MATKKSGGISRVFVWIILGLLIIGLVGFGSTNFGGNIRSIGNVGTAEITVNRYANAITADLRQFGAQIGRQVTFAEAQAFGLDRAVLQRLIAGAAMEHEATRVGLSVGDAEIAEQVRNRSDFDGLDGEFDPDLYQFALEQQGISAAEFEESLRAEAASSIVQAGVSAGVNVPDAHARTIQSFIGEARSFSWVLLGEADLETAVAEPTQSELEAFYDADPEAFMLPEMRSITYAWLSPETVLEGIDIPQEELRALYDDRGDIYNQPERRLVERLVYADEAQANAASEAIAAGETTFDDLVSERGLELEDVDLGDQSAQELGVSAELVFALTEPGVVGPVPTNLGPALFRVNAILAARVTAFEDAQEELRQELASDSARRQIEDQITEFDDLLAGGATVEELAAETGMTLETIQWSVGSTDGIAAYPTFANTAAITSVDDFPEIIELDDGGVFAMRVDEIIDAAPEPFEDAQSKVAQAWTAQNVQDAIQALAATVKAQVDNGARLSSLGYITDVETQLTRDTFIEGAPQAMVAEVFKLEDGQSVVVAGAQSAAIVQLSEIHAADVDSSELAAIGDNINAQAAQSISRDILTAFTQAVEAEAGIDIDQTVLGQLHLQFQ